MGWGKRFRDFWVGHDPETWPGVQLLVSTELPGRVYFPTRDALEHFLDAIESEMGQRAELIRFEDSLRPPVFTADDLFKLTAHGMYGVAVRTPRGNLLIDNRTRKSVSSISALGSDAESTQAVQSFIALTKRYVRPVPAWRRFSRTPAVTRVPDAEQRDNRWKLNVGIWSAAIGGLLGFLGGLLSGSLLPGG